MNNLPRLPENEPPSLKQVPAEAHPDVSVHDNNAFRQELRKRLEGVTDFSARNQIIADVLTTRLPASARLVPAQANGEGGIDELTIAEMAKVIGASSKDAIRELVQFTITQVATMGGKLNDAIRAFQTLTTQESVDRFDLLPNELLLMIFENLDHVSRQTFWILNARTRGIFISGYKLDLGPTLKTQDFWFDQIKQIFHNWDEQAYTQDWIRVNAKKHAFQFSASNPQRPRAFATIYLLLHVLLPKHKPTPVVVMPFVARLFDEETAGSVWRLLVFHDWLATNFGSPELLLDLHKIFVKRYLKQVNGLLRKYVLVFGGQIFVDEARLIEVHSPVEFLLRYFSVFPFEPVGAFPENFEMYSWYVRMLISYEMSIGEIKRLASLGELVHTLRQNNLRSTYLFTTLHGKIPHPPDFLDIYRTLSTRPPRTVFEEKILSVQFTQGLMHPLYWRVSPPVPKRLKQGTLLNDYVVLTIRALLAKLNVDSLQINLQNRARVTIKTENSNLHMSILPDYHDPLTGWHRLREHEKAAVIFDYVHLWYNEIGRW